MLSPYREQAIIKLEPVPLNTFSYYINKDKSKSRPYYCPICNGPLRCWNDTYQDGKSCYPTKRVTVKGFWFWRKKCPLSGIHRHFKCRECNAISIIYDNANEPESKSISL